MKGSPSDQLDAEALFVLGSCRLKEGDLTGAEACFREAFELDSTSAEACANLALLLERRGLSVEAESCYLQALALNPIMPACSNNLANLLTGQKRFKEAEQIHRQVLKLEPNSPIAWTNLGVLYACMQRANEAEDCHRKALEIEPNYTTAHFNLSYLLLQQGRFDEGWRHFEARKWYEGLASRMPCARWQGESLAGKSLLVGFEAGHGDMVQFCRYMPLLKAQGAVRIDLICHPALASLFKTLDGVDEIIPYDRDLPGTHWDCWTPLLSIPFHCHTRVDTIPAQIPYLRADSKRVGRWKAELPQDGLRVGLAWKGNPLYENDADRSLPNLALLKPLFNVPGMRFVSLQKGPGEEEVLAADWPVVNVGAKIENFADTAAIIENLDLVISVDTAIAHLAGALGKRCWVLLPDYMTDWRWFIGREDTPWYPETMRLFRQTATREWVEVIARVKEALRLFAGNH